MRKQTISGKHFKHIRKALGITQRELADQLSLTRSQVAQYESNCAMPSGDAIIKLHALRLRYYRKQLIKKYDNPAHEAIKALEESILWLDYKVK